ncbi:hypothetical protein [Herbiconiux sp. VKM Ac-2851]|uniref:hypothetical protein n=1 Tax=Herbiconiux sp. VKM Ac-2851 TaxID=2739025 RepID=UPI001565AD88|nr:hypothetical protein [Herbiconiux sp. VKM Ac-2851]NQX36246.1 hypothetical protein [Herbiconiux sp. VKM Ac-2851]
MRQHSAQLREVLALGSFDHEYTFDLYYDRERRRADMPVEDVKLNEDATGTIQQSGSLTVLWTDEFGASLSPSGIGDELAPFGAVIHLFSTITAGSFRERVLMGQYEITNVPAALDEQAVFQGQNITINSVVDIEFKELLNSVEQDRFDAPYAPRDLSSTWAELARVVGMPIVRSLPDAPISRSVVYEESRIDAIYDLAEQVGGVPHITPEGALAVRPDAWPAPVDTLERGNKGTVVEVQGALSSDGVSNRVVIRGRSDEQESILGIAEITEGPLRVRNADGSQSPFRRRTRYFSSEYVTNNDQGAAWARKQLPVVSRLSVTLDVTEFFNPLRERGDVLRLRRGEDLLLVRILDIRRDSGPEMDMTVEVAGG